MQIFFTHSNLFQIFFTLCHFCTSRHFVSTSRFVRIVYLKSANRRMRKCKSTQVHFHSSLWHFHSSLWHFHSSLSHFLTNANRALVDLALRSWWLVSSSRFGWFRRLSSGFVFSSFGRFSVRLPLVVSSRLPCTHLPLRRLVWFRVVVLVSASGSRRLSRFHSVSRRSL